ncbi:hypothetical protein BDZ89DRAFT_1087945 [Hymenopellis radicata]|nr:hypothetical protein BDZ89DRAFT_1087945 [Hymenopellis radicata]
MYIALASILTLLPRFVVGLGDPAIVNFDAGLSLVSLPIVVDANDWPGVHVAAENLAQDFERVSGVRSQVINATNASDIDSSAIIFVGSLNRSPLTQQLVDGGILDTSAVDGQWETFTTSLVEQPFEGVDTAFIIAGSDKRGTIYGAYTLSEQIGVSPWYWWADVNPKSHSEIYANNLTTVQGPPSIKYRGLFINDEAPALTSVVLEKFGPVYNVEFYNHVCMASSRSRIYGLRLCRWPAFPEPGNSFFTDDPLNAFTADEYGIVVSTSHHEPMERATNEWLTSGNGSWDWTQNKENITQFFVDGTERAVGRESYFTIGMRGDTDVPVSGDDPVAILKDVIATQRSVIADAYGNETGVNQVWALYKEVQGLYEAGVKVPDDVTLLFADDNFGNLRRLPTEAERQRAGGTGVYYHLEVVGPPRSYKWINTNSLGKVQQQLAAAKDMGADRMWIINVADIKPMETPLSMIMAMAWNASLVAADTLPHYLELYAAREFPEEHAVAVADLLLRHSRLVGLRRHEHVEPTTFSLLNYHEAEWVEGNWTALLNDATTLYNQVAEADKPAFFQLVLHPIKASQIFISGKCAVARNALYAEQRRNSANDQAQLALDLFDADFDLQGEYHSLLDGKWDQIMRQPHFGFTSGTFETPLRDMLTGISYVQRRQNASPSVGQMGVSVEGTKGVRPGMWNEGSDLGMPLRGELVPGVTLPVMDPYSGDRYFEVWGRGTPELEWSVAAAVPWIDLEPSRGNLAEGAWDARIGLSVQWDAVPEGFNETVLVHVNSTIGDYEQVHVPILKPSVPSDFVGFVESAGYVSMEAAHFTSSSSDGTSYGVFLTLGSRTSSGAVGIVPNTAPAQSIPEGEYLAYAFYQVSSPASIVVTLYFTTTLDYDSEVPMSYGVSLDNGNVNATRLVPEPATVGDLPTGWTTAIMDVVWVRTVTYNDVGAGDHVLRYWAGKPGILLEKIVVDMGGPPESTRAGE